MTKKKLNITPLTRDEKDLLKGGFSSIERNSDSSESMKNTNCSGDAWWSNGNCGCNACNATISSN